MSFYNVTLKSLYTSIPINNRTTTPIRTLSIQLVAQDYPIGFNIVYSGVNPCEDITEIIGPTQEQSQNLSTIPTRITLIATIILNGSIYTVPKDTVIYLNNGINEVTGVDGISGLTNSVTVTAQNPTLKLL